MVPEERGVHPRGNFESLAETLSSQRKKLNYLFSAFSATLRDIWFTHAAMAIGEKNAIFFFVFWWVYRVDWPAKCGWLCLRMLR